MLDLCDSSYQEVLAEYLSQGKRRTESSTFLLQTRRHKNSQVHCMAVITVESPRKDSSLSQTITILECNLNTNFTHSPPP